MKKILLLISVFSFMFASVNVYTCGANVNGDEVTFDICADSPNSDIGGFQFTYAIDGEGFDITGTSGGATDIGFTVQAGGGTVLGFSFTGAAIPAGENIILTQITGSFNSGSNMIIGPQNVVISDPTASSVDAYGETSEWDGGTLLDGDHPAEYSLKEAYPNPFNPTTTIEYNIETAGNVSIVVYDLMGREIKELVNEFKSPLNNGTYSIMWDGTNNSGNIVSSGMYIYRMISNDFTKTHRLTLMK